MQSLSAFFHRRASWWILAVAFIVYMLFNGLLLPRAEQAINTLAGKKVGIIDLGMNLSTAQVRQQVADYGPEGRALYRRTELTTDIIYPLAYATFFTLLLTLLMRGLPLSPGLRQANILPFAMEGLDLLENACIVTLLGAYPDQSDAVLLLAVVFRTLKWLIFLATVGLILFLLGKRFFARRTAG